MSKVCRYGIHIAAVAGQLLCRKGQKGLRGAVFGICSACKGIEIQGCLLTEGLAKILPRAGVVAQFTGNGAGLQEAV